MRKVAIPTRSGNVDEHFGHCESFTIYTLDEAKAVVATESFTPPPACGCKSNLVGTLKDMGVGTLLAGNMGQGAVMKLEQAGIAVLRGAAGPVEQVLKAWLDGTLKDNQLLCAAHEHGHDCLHGH